MPTLLTPCQQLITLRDKYFRTTCLGRPWQDPGGQGATVTANELMKANIKALLAIRQKTPDDLAKWCRNHKSWIDKIFREDRRTFPIEYYDKIAKFFGIEMYQLLQPGIADRSERRVSVGDRRKVLDRRVSRVVLSEKPLDTDLIHVVRALSPDGRRKAIGVLMDILNDELRVPRTRSIVHVAQDHSDGARPEAALPTKRKKTPTPTH